MKRILGRQHWLVLLLGVFSIFLLTGSAHADLLGWWTMDDANYPPGYFDPPAPPTTADSSGNGNVGVLDGVSTTGISPGYSDYGATIGDGGAILCGTDDSIKMGSAGGTGYTFASWVKFDEVGQVWQIIGADWKDGGGQWGFHFTALNDNLDLYYGNAAGDYGGHVATTSTMTVDTWTHVAFTITPSDGVNDGDVKVYRDGALVGSGAYADTTLPMTDQQVILGDKADRGQFPLRGALDETAIWTSALTGSDVGSLASGTSPGTVSTGTLGGYWQFEESLSSPVPAPTAIVIDSSGNGRDGVMTPNGVDPFHPAGGKVDGAVELSGAKDFIDVGDIDGISEEMTIVGWIKPSDLEGLQIVLSQSDDFAPDEWAFQVFLLGDKAEFYVSDPIDLDGFVFVAEGEGITTDDWSHLALTIASNDGGTTGEVKAYVNGVQVGETLAYDTESLVDSSKAIRFGNKGNVDPYGSFNGLMDDVALFDEALSADDVALLYSEGVSAVAAVPEPSVIVLLLCGLGLLMSSRRR